MKLGLLQGIFERARNLRGALYDRFWHQETRYLITGYIFIQATRFSGFTFNVLRPHLTGHYSKLCFFSLLQKASVLTFSHRLTELMRNYNNTTGRHSRKQFHLANKWLAQDFAAYIALYEFTEVSNQLQAVELFELLRRHLQLKPLFDELHLQLNYSAQVENANYEEHLSSFARFWVPAAVAFAWL